MVLKEVIATLAIVFCVSCSASRQIAESASAVRASGERIARQADYIIAASSDAGVVAAATDIRTDADLILEHGSRISISVASVNDKVPAWMTMLQWLAIAIAGVAAAWILTASGALGAIRAALGWIPKRKVMDASLARQVMDESSPTGMREYIAARRASDPEFNAAFVRSWRPDGTPSPTDPAQQPR